VEEVD